MTSDLETRRAESRTSDSAPAAENPLREANSIVHIPDYIDLRPLLASPAAAEMLLLARGQLNRAFRKHGLVAPDPLLPAALAAFDPAELDDPAAGGIEHATARFHEAFASWSARMPTKLARPVLDILHQTYEGLSTQAGDSGAAIAAVLEAYDFLLACFQPATDQPNAAERQPAPHDRPASPRMG